MSNRVLIIGGLGRIGSSVAVDLAQHTQAEITVTGRKARSLEKLQARCGRLVRFCSLDLVDEVSLTQAIAQADLVIHCAGPFRYRDTQVLEFCIRQGVPYLDVSDDRSFTQQAIAQREAAKSAGVTAIVNTGVFPGISNSMVRQAIEQFDQPEEIHLSYVVAGSGGAGVTVMRTTFLGLQHPFEVWLDGRWQQMQPYTDREVIEFPPPFGRTGVYWFNMPEAFTLAEAFPVKSAIVKFGSAPDFYNSLTAIVARRFPSKLVQHPATVEFLAKVSHWMTDITDRFSGIGVAMRATVRGIKDQQIAEYDSVFAHENTATAAGYGTGSIAELVLSGQLKAPGVWAVEEALSTDLFEQTLQSRGIQIQRGWRSDSPP